MIDSTAVQGRGINHLGLASVRAGGENPNRCSGSGGSIDCRGAIAGRAAWQAWRSCWAHGGWIVRRPPAPGGLVEPSSTCCTIGIGGNITFDLELIERFGVPVRAFDAVVGYMHHTGSVRAVRELAAALGGMGYEPVDRPVVKVTFARRELRG